MSDGTKIEWTDATVNAVNGCSVLSPGCKHCYAMRLAGTRLRDHPSRAGLTQPSCGGPVWTGEVRLNEKALLDPLRWKKPRMIFWNAHGDLFHPNVPDEWIDRVFAVCALTPQHTHQILTKRPERMREFLTRPGFQSGRNNAILAMTKDQRAPFGDRRYVARCVTEVVLADTVLPNVWLGVSVEDQKRADERIPHLLATPAAVRFLSCEPLLSQLELGCIDPLDGAPAFGADMLDPVKGEGWIFDEDGELDHIIAIPKLDWIIVGGESGPGARPMHPDWAQSLRDQCAAAEVPFFFKQWGEWGPDTGPDEDFDRDGYRRDRIMEGAGPCAVRIGDQWKMFDNGYAVPIDLCSGHGAFVYRLGKKRNGRLMDGVEHNGFPA